MADDGFCKTHINYLLCFLVKDLLWNVADASYKERTQWLRKPCKFSRRPVTQDVENGGLYHRGSANVVIV